MVVLLEKRLLARPGRAGIEWFLGFTLCSRTVAGRGAFPASLQ
jgi:hypothetical protein